ncbi:MAG: hypothetical protein WBK76_03845 [Candidatus Saccharimonadales bacterium]
MAKKKIQKKTTHTTARHIRERVFESDSTYFLKLVVVVLLGTLWLKFSDPFTLSGFMFTAIPLGIIAGFLIVRAFEPHQLDRKIWYAVLLIVGVITYFVPAGIVI